MAAYFGTDGSDSLEGSSQDDQMDGGALGAAADDLGGDTLAGFAGNDLLIGRAGADSLSGGAGDDSGYGDDGNDTLLGGGGLDTVWAGPGDDLLVDTAGGGHLQGEQGDDTLIGVVAGDARIPILFANGGPGNDSISVTGDGFAAAPAFSALIYGGDGNDTLRGSRAADALFGGLDEDALYGGGGDDLLQAEAGADTLSGGDGRDTLSGGVGADRMAGGAGDDTYHLDEAGDVVLEAPGGGIDLLLATRSATLGAELEHLGLVGRGAMDGTGNGLDNRIEGNEAVNVLAGAGGADTLSGAGGGDTLDGGFGADRMSGGTGADRYLVDDAGDVVVERNDEGTDQVIASVDWTLGEHVELLLLAGAEALAGTGNALANRIEGNAGANLLRGAGGRDVLSGGDGADTLDGGGDNNRLTGGEGDDAFLFAEASGELQTLTDFASGTDALLIDAVAFGGGLVAGDLDPDRFVEQASGHANSAAGVGQFIYLTGRGLLLWDADGMGLAEAIRVAALGEGASLDAADFRLL